MKKELLSILLFLYLFQFKGLAQIQQIPLLDSTYRYRWDTTLGDWNKVGRSIYTYNTNGNTLESVNSVWVPEINSWRNLARRIYTGFDIFGNYRETAFYSWNIPTNSWKNISRKIFTFNDAGIKTASVDYTWSTDLLIWEFVIRDTFIYDSDGNLIDDTQYRWSKSTNTWGNERRYVYNYDENGNETEVITYEWHPEEWYLLDKDVKTYDAGGNMLTHYSYGWSNINQGWYSSHSHLQTFDATGNMTERINRNFDPQSDSWINSSRILNQFDASNNLISLTLYSWNYEFSYWAPYVHGTYTNDANNNRVETVLSVVNGLNSFLFAEKEYNYWSQHSISSVHDGEIIQCSIYPNPSHNELYIKGLSGPTRAAVYSLQGALKQTAMLNSGAAQLDIQQLPEGIYFLHLNAGGKTTVRKFVKQ